MAGDIFFVIAPKGSSLNGIIVCLTTYNCYIHWGKWKLEKRNVGEATNAERTLWERYGFKIIDI